MARMNVYQYDYFDRLLKHDRRSVDFATTDVIAAMGAKPLGESQRSVDEDLIPDSGVIRAADMPPREIIEAFPRTPPGATRMGPD